jgi:hypothetical protein
MLSPLRAVNQAVRAGLGAATTAQEALIARRCMAR